MNFSNSVLAWLAHGWWTRVPQRGHRPQIVLPWIVCLKIERERGPYHGNYDTFMKEGATTKKHLIDVSPRHASYLPGSAIGDFSMPVSEGNGTVTAAFFCLMTYANHKGWFPDFDTWNESPEAKKIAKIILTLTDIHCQWEYTASLFDSARKSISHKNRANKRSKLGPHNMISAYEPVVWPFVSNSS